MLVPLVQTVRQRDRVRPLDSSATPSDNLTVKLLRMAATAVAARPASVRIDMWIGLLLIVAYAALAVWVLVIWYAGVGSFGVLFRLLSSTVTRQVTT